MALRLVFMGTPDFSVPTLEAMAASGHQIAAVYSQPPRPAGRGMDERKSPVHIKAEALGIPVSTPKSLRSREAEAQFAAHRADAAVVVAYGLLLPRAILDLPRHGCLNLHGSELPRWRGAAPIQRAIMAGDRRTAVQVMRMEEGLDTGPICLSAEMRIGPEMTAGELHDEMSVTGARLMMRALERLAAGQLSCTPQSNEGVTYARKIEKAEAHLDFTKPAATVHDIIRGLSPFPGAWFEVGTAGRSERIKVLRSIVTEADAGTSRPGVIIAPDLTVACGTGAIRLVELQRAGKKPMAASELLRGFALPVGTQLV